MNISNKYNFKSIWNRKLKNECMNQTCLQVTFFESRVKSRVFLAKSRVFIVKSQVKSQVFSGKSQVKSQVISVVLQVKSRVLFITSCAGSRIRYDNTITLSMSQVFTTVSRATYLSYLLNRVK